MYTIYDFRKVTLFSNFATFLAHVKKLESLFTRLKFEIIYFSKKLHARGISSETEISLKYSLRIKWMEKLLLSIE